MRRLRQPQQQWQSQAGPSSPRSVASTATAPHTPRTPRGLPPTGLPTASPELHAADHVSRHTAPDRLQPGSIPATPDTAEFSGNSGRSESDHVQPAGSGLDRAEQMLRPEMLASPAKQVMSAAPVRSPAYTQLFGLPSAEDIDALCDLDTFSPQQPQAFPPPLPVHDNTAYHPDERHHALAPVMTTGSAALENEAAQHMPGVPKLWAVEAVTPQHSSSQFKSTPLGQHRQSFPPNSLFSRSNLPDSSMPYSQASRLQSECDSSAFDEGASSTLIHSISNEEQNMHDLLGDDNDDMFYNVMDTQQPGSEMGDGGLRAQQLNTMELHGILGQHGYKLPELAADQEEEESDGDDGLGDGDEDIDDPDVDEDDEDEDASKAIFKVDVALTGMYEHNSSPSLQYYSATCPLNPSAESHDSMQSACSCACA